MSRHGGRYFVASSKYHSLVPLGSLRLVDVVCPPRLGVYQRSVYRRTVTIPVSWDPNFHRFSELCNPPKANLASRH
ncbi:jg17391 [Pararge aegeria aegeria]|uniref:Jg17391 protein n=1 Tax=Pararge aegeria aegeria TaxID=348720 RepID=A0A8S4RXG3_9NEOP|nr:jg17391 [Pararge aegeria aegeria]